MFTFQELSLRPLFVQHIIEGFFGPLVGLIACIKKSTKVDENQLAHPAECQHTYLIKITLIFFVLR